MKLKGLDLDFSEKEENVGKKVREGSSSMNV